MKSRHAGGPEARDSTGPGLGGRSADARITSMDTTLGARGAPGTCRDDGGIPNTAAETGRSRPVPCGAAGGDR